MAIRLNKTTRDLNVGLSTIVEFLREKGFSIEKNPNVKISDEEYELLIKEFSTNKDLKLESVKIDQKQLPKKEKESVAEEIFKIDAPVINFTVKVIDKIPDLYAVNRVTRPKKKAEDDLSFYESGNDYKAKGEYDKAIENYNKALALYPGDEDYYAERGEAKLLKGDFEGAIADFRKVIEICPSDSWGYYMSAWAEESAKQYDKALNDYNQIIKMLPENAYTYYHRAQVLMLMGRTEEAKADFETVVLQNPVISVEDNNKPFALFYLGRKAEAIDWQNKILEAYPTAERQYDTACLYSVMNEKELALEYLESALKNGFKDFLHIQADTDLDTIRKLAEYEVLITNYNFSAETFVPDTTSQTIYPWEDVIACLDKRLESDKFAKHDCCPHCWSKSENLIWIEFCSPKWTWQNLCGRQGPLSICPRCKRQVEFITEIMN